VVIKKIYLGSIKSSGNTNMLSSVSEFTLSHNKVTLKSFEYFPLIVTFQSSHPGDFKCRLEMLYSYVIDAQNACELQLRGLNFNGVVGTREVTFDTQYIPFMDVPIGSSLSKKISFLNKGNGSAFIQLAQQSGFKLSCSKLNMEPNSNEDVIVTYEPIESQNWQKHLEFLINGITHSISLTGNSGSFDLTSNLVKFIICDHETDLDSIIPSSKNIIDFGISVMEKSNYKILDLKNDGNLQIVISKIDVGSESNFFLTHINSDLKNSEIRKQTFPQDSPFQNELDWDELDQNLAGVILHNSTNNIPDSESIRIFPSSHQSIQIIFRGKHFGDFIVPVKIVCVSPRTRKNCFVFWIKGCIQPLLQLESKHIKLGLCPAHLVKTASFKFSNVGKTQIPWRLSTGPIVYQAVKNMSISCLSDQILLEGGPVAIYPKDGILGPGVSQVVEIKFMPSIPQYSITSSFYLHSSDFGKKCFVISGTCGSSNFQMDEFDGFMGILRVGQVKVRKFSIRNTGLIQLKYFIECENKYFCANPEQGILEAGSVNEISVEFYPKRAGDHQGALKIFATSEDLTLIPNYIIYLNGSGGYPDIFVQTKVIDFKIALYKNPNRRLFLVENKGDAEANLLVSCVHPYVKMESYDVTVGPQSKLEVAIVYTPQIVETLDTNLFIESSDKRGDIFMISLKAKVGIPKLSVKPEGAIGNLNFNVLRLNQTYEKVFTLINDGTIFLKYEVFVTPICICEISTQREKNSGMRRIVSNIHCPISVFPVFGSIGVGEEVIVTIQITPTMLLEYEYEITINYDLQKIVGNISAVGGRALLENLSFLQSLDFGASRVGSAYKKAIIFHNVGNLGVKFVTRPEPADGNWSLYDKELEQLKEDAPNNIPTNLEEDKEWQKQLAFMGLYLTGFDGYQLF
jgi:hypothetical protein